MALLVSIDPRTEPPPSARQALEHMVRDGLLRVVWWDPTWGMSLSGEKDLRVLWDRYPYDRTNTVMIDQDMSSLIFEQRLHCYPIADDDDRAGRWHHCLIYLFLRSRKALRSAPSSG